MNAKNSAIIREMDSEYQRQPSIYKKIKIKALFNCFRIRNFYKKTHTYTLACTPRSGSNLLLNYLDCQEQVGVFYEIFEESHVLYSKMPNATDKMIESIQQSCNTSVAIFKFFLDKEIALNNSMIDAIKSQKGSIIILYRRNLLEQYYSHTKAKLNNDWASTGHQNPQTKLYADINELELFCNFYKKIYREFVDQCKKCNLDYIKISYEDLIADPEKQLKQKISNFLHVPIYEFASNMKKQNTSPMSDVIKNYDRVIKYFTTEQLTLEINPLKLS